MNLVSRLDFWFSENLKYVKCSDDTRAYIVGVLSKFKPENDLSNQSLVLMYYDAKTSGNFYLHQKIGDWALWCQSLHYLSISNKDLTETFGKLSYYSCYRLTGYKWEVYNELADNLSSITYQVYEIMSKRR